MPEPTTEKANKNEQNDAGRFCYNANLCVINWGF